MPPALEDNDARDTGSYLAFGVVGEDAAGAEVEESVPVKRVHGRSPYGLPPSSNVRANSLCASGESVSAMLDVKMKGGLSLGASAIRIQRAWRRYLYSPQSSATVVKLGSLADDDGGEMAMDIDEYGEVMRIDFDGCGENMAITIDLDGHDPIETTQPQTGPDWQPSHPPPSPRLGRPRLHLIPFLAPKYPPGLPVLRPSQGRYRICGKLVKCKITHKTMAERRLENDCKLYRYRVRYPSILRKCWTPLDESEQSLSDAEDTVGGATFEGGVQVGDYEDMVSYQAGDGFDDISCDEDHSEGSEEDEIRDSEDESDEPEEEL